jgi:cobalt/nickel transport system permease protein
MPTARWRQGADFARAVLPTSLVVQSFSLYRSSVTRCRRCAVSLRAALGRGAEPGMTHDVPPLAEPSIGVRPGAGAAGPLLFAATSLGSMVLPSTAHAMHLAEGILPLSWAALWTGITLPFVMVALSIYRKRASGDVFYRPLVAMVAAAVFLISCMPIPVPTAGTCSHPCGTGLGAILIGPWMTVLVTVVALLLQALFLAHGGLTTLGADVLSMGVAGSFAGYAAFHGLRRCGVPLWAAAFAAGLLSDWATYAVTALELASALHGARPFHELWLTVVLAFVPTQLPLGILEGALTAGAVSFLYRRRRDILERLQIIPAPRVEPA